MTTQNIDNGLAEAVIPTVLSAKLIRTLSWLVGLSLLFTIYFAKALLVPIVVALLFSLFLNPLVTWLKRLYIPRTISAILVLCFIGATFTLLTIELAVPAQRWVKKIPDLSADFTEKVSVITDTLTTGAPGDQPVAKTVVKAESDSFSLFGLFSEEKVIPVPPEPIKEKSGGDVVNEKIIQGGLEVMVSIMRATPLMVAQLITTVILTIFLLIFGPKLFDAFIQIFPQVKNKRHTQLLVLKIQSELSRYVLTISIINSCLALITAAALWWLGVQDALLWGALVGLLNFAPYVGPLIAMIILCLAGLVQYGPVALAMLPALVYFVINLIEAQFITPTVLGRHMRLNPLILILWLVIWAWLWGAVGVLLAVPLLVCIKLVAGHLNKMENWLKLIESRV
jgi:predicted PurR-regulated permease PerM